jgi:glycosyltransferase involved in cell wall biosynthesis
VKVLFLNPIGELGGAERSLLDLAWSLRQSAPEMELELLTFADGPLVAEAEALGVRALVLPLPDSLNRLGESGERIMSVLGRLVPAGPAALSFVRELRGVLGDSRADIVHSNGLKSHILAALAETGQPLIWHLRDFISRRSASRLLLPHLEKRVSLGLAISRAVANDARRVLTRVRIETVLGAVRTELFRDRGAPGLDLDALAGMPSPVDEVVRVGLIATYGRWKGQELFLQAVARVGVPHARFYLIGGPIYAPGASQWRREALQARMSELGISGRCGLIPFQPDTPQVYSALDIVVHASTEPEPFGRTVAEALASGRAVVAAGSGGVLEQITSGEQGLLFAPSSADSLASAMMRLIKERELRERLARAGAQHARALLDARRLGPAVAAIYRALVPARRGAAR